MHNFIRILNSQRQMVGEAEATLCATLQDLTENFCIHKYIGALNYYETQFGYADYWPIFVLNDIEIEFPHRKAGIGSRACNEIADHYQELGARLGLLRIGTQGDELEEGIAWRTRFYSKVGWVTLRLHPDDPIIMPLMYLPMRQRTIATVRDNRLIEVLDRDPNIGNTTGVFWGGSGPAPPNDPGPG